MDSHTEVLFAPMKAALLREPYGICDLFELIGHWINTPRPDVGAAMAYHARDILTENPNLNYSHVIAEVYRRTFFDPETAQKYGTLDMAQQPTHMHEAFVHHVVESLNMDHLLHERSDGGVTHTPSAASH
jgi:hypothetical protein